MEGVKGGILGLASRKVSGGCHPRTESDDSDRGRHADTGPFMIDFHTEQHKLHRAIRLLRWIPHSTDDKSVGCDD